MKNSNFFEKFDELTNNKYKFLRIDQINLSEDTSLLKIVFTIPYDMYESEYFTVDDKVIIQNACDKIVPNQIKVNIEYKKLQISNDVVRRLVLDFITKNYIRIFETRFLADKLEIQIDSKLVSVVISVDEGIYSYCKELGFLDQLTEFLKEKIWLDIKCDVKSVKIIENTSVSSSKNAQILVDDGIVFMTKKELVLGPKIYSYPYYIAKYTKPRLNVTVCGKVIDYQKKISKSGKLFYIFSIEDPTGIMNCIYFSKGKDKSKFDYVHLNTHIYVNGDLKVNDFSKKLVLTVNTVYKAEIDFEKTLEKINYIKSYELKSIVPTPKPYFDAQEKQYSLLEEQPYIAPILRQKDFVVFDLETTGLDLNKCKICEIGACRVSHGQIVSTFSTLVDPKCPMPLSAMEVNNITDDMVKDAPTFDYVIQPFLDYCKNATLVGHNAIKFDYPFIKAKAQEEGYDINFECLDTIHLYKQYDTTAKYAKLSNCIAKFNITNNEAHRALADAIATAKLFIRLCNELKL